MRWRMGRKKEWIILVMGIGVLGMIPAVIAFPARGQVARASTIRAASCSQSDVQAAIDAASDGDTVAVPAGNCTWTTAVNINGKGIVV